MKRYELLMASFLALAVLAGCDKEQSAPQAPAPPTAVAKPPVQSVAPPEEVAPPETPKYVYMVEGRRDPFVPLVGKQTAVVSENPLESFDLVQFQLKGLIVGFGEPKAIVAAPDGKSYILKKGVRIGKSNGVVRDINRERILVEEQYQDLTGATHSNIQEIKVPKREGV
ncbi:MAG: pilus assembly protein PilP [Desulfuromonas sp.]|nr:pilus assembly protein PilP [Desulfuromonas sp.]